MRLLVLDLHDRSDTPYPPGLLRYLESAAVLIARRSRTIDEIVPVRGPVVPSSVLTDGEWVWSASHAYYVRTHRVRVPDEFRQYVDRVGEPPTQVPVARLAELRAELTRLGL